jgi:hypothetical protein
VGDDDDSCPIGLHQCIGRSCRYCTLAGGCSYGSEHPLAVLHSRRGPLGKRRRRDMPKQKPGEYQRSEDTTVAPTYAEQGIDLVRASDQVPTYAEQGIDKRVAVR